MSPLGIGIVGMGQRGMLFFGPYLLEHRERGRLVAVADHDETRLAGAVEDLGHGLRPYPTLDAMLEDPEVDAVIITTPDLTHRTMVERVLQAGKHVICEKPMATTIEDAVAMAQQAMRAPCVVQLGFMLRYAPFFQRLKQLVDSGAIGPLVHVAVSEIVEYYHGASFFRRWHRFRSNSGGLLVHKACHTLDVLTWIIGGAPGWVSGRAGLATFKPVEGAAERCRACSLASSCPAAYRPFDYNWVYQTAWERQDPGVHGNDLCVFNSTKDSPDSAALQVGYDNGVHLAFSFATTGARHERHVLLVGQTGQIHASQADGVISVEPVGGDAQTIVLPEELRDEHGGGDEPLMESFFDCVERGTKPVADVLAGLHSVAIGAGATRSSDLGGAVVNLRPSLVSLS